MIGPDVVPGVPTADGMESWCDTTVPFATSNVEGMPGELATYLELARSVAERLPPDHDVVLAIEPDWDGCEGRWLNMHVGATSMSASLCAVALLDPERLASKGTDVAAALPVLGAGGWNLVESSTPNDRWGYWERVLPEDRALAAREALIPALALFAVYEPRRWFVAADMTWSQGARIDLRRWRTRRGLEPPPPTVAPVGSEPWAMLCDCGYHSMHEPPCWEPEAPWPTG